LSLPSNQSKDLKVLLQAFVLCLSCLLNLIGYFIVPLIVKNRWASFCGNLVWMFCAGNNVVVYILLNRWWLVWNLSVFHCKQKFSSTVKRKFLAMRIFKCFSQNKIGNINSIVLATGQPCQRVLWFITVANFSKGVNLYTNKITQLFSTQNQESTSKKNIEMHQRHKCNKLAIKLVYNVQTLQYRFCDSRRILRSRN